MSVERVGRAVEDSEAGRASRLWHADDKTPSPGDRTICLYCSCWSAYDEDLRLRHLTEDELAEMADDPRVNLMYQFAHQYRQEHP